MRQLVVRGLMAATGRVTPDGRPSTPAKLGLMSALVQQSKDGGLTDDHDYELALSGKPVGDWWVWTLSGEEDTVRAIMDTVGAVEGEDPAPRPAPVDNDRPRAIILREGQ